MFQGLSFLALIMLTGKLYDVDKEVNFLKLISSEWLNFNASISSNNITFQNNNQLNAAVIHFENFKQDVDMLISK